MIRCSFPKGKKEGKERGRKERRGEGRRKWSEGITVNPVSFSGISQLTHT